MIRPFVQSESDRKRLHAFMESWLGTPFHAHAGIKSVGVDCVNLAAEIYKEAGLLRHCQFPAYAIDAGQHRQDSMLLGWLDHSPSFEHVEEGREVGDLFCFRFGRSAHHLGICAGGGKFIHALLRRSVRYACLDDPTYGRRLVATYRPVIEN
jgi:cell wall-associated NlpC family hydrolase